MGTNKLTPDVTKYLNNPSQTKQNINDAFGPYNNLHDVDQGDMAATVGVITAGGASTQDGAAIYDTLAAANTPTREFSLYDTTFARKVAPSGRRNVARASLPASGQIGEKFYITDLQIEVEWRNAADDLLLTGGTGVAGWHPTSAAYALMENKNALSIAAHSVVIADVTDDNTRKINTTAIEKDARVIGVTLEAIATAQTGYIAKVSGGAIVPVLVGGLAFGAVAAGDVLVTSTTAGTAREVGPHPGTVTPTTGANYIGLQRGGFARALAAQAADAVVMCQLLGQVGTGLHVTHTAIGIWSDSTPPAGATSVDARKAASGTNGAQGAVSLQDASHGPLLAFTGYLYGNGTSGTYTSWSLAFGKFTTDQFSIADNAPDMGANDEYNRLYPLPMIPTSDSTGITAGSEFKLAYFAGSGVVTWPSFTIFRNGYIC